MSNDLSFSDFGPAVGGLGVIQGAASGTPTGEAGAAVGTAKLATNAGLLGGSSGGLASTLGPAASVLGIIAGIEEGGGAGYSEAVEAAINPELAAASGALDFGITELGKIGGGGMDMNSQKWANMSPTQQALTYNPSSNPLSPAYQAFVQAASNPPKGKYFAGVGANGLPVWGDTPMQYGGTYEGGLPEPGSASSSSAELAALLESPKANGTPTAAKTPPAAAAVTPVSGNTSGKTAATTAAAAKPATAAAAKPAAAATPKSTAAAPQNHQQQAASAQQAQKAATVTKATGIAIPTIKWGVEAVRSTLAPAVQTFGSSAQPGPDISEYLAGPGNIAAISGGTGVIGTGAQSGSALNG